MIDDTDRYTHVCEISSCTMKCSVYVCVRECVCAYAYLCVCVFERQTDRQSEQRGKQRQRDRERHRER